MKIADFGLARDIQHIDYYKKTTNVNVCFERADQACFALDDSIGFFRRAVTLNRKCFDLAGAFAGEVDGSRGAL